MADFRRSIIVLAALALILGTVSTASAAAPPFACIASGGTPAQVRSQGLTEKVGDLLITCTGGTPTDPGSTSGTVTINVIPVANVQVFLNTSLTSRLLTASTNASEAELLIDDPTEANVRVCLVGQATSCNDFGNGASATSPFVPGAGGGAAVTGGNPYNVYQGQQVTPASVTFNNVPIDPPGTQGTRVFRVTNIRADANALGVTSANAPPVGISETITVSSGAQLPINNNAQQVVAFVLNGLVVTPGALTAFQQCVSQTFALAETIQLTKGFPAAFKIRNIGTTPSAPNALLAQDNLSQNQGTENPAIAESDYYDPNAAVNPITNAGLADFGTRLRVVVGGVQSGVTVWVPVTLAFDPTMTTNALNGTVVNTGAPANATSLYAVLVTSEGGAFTAATANGTGASAGYESVTISSTGVGEAVYEVLQVNPGVVESLTVPVYISYTANPGANSPGLGTATIGGSFAPISTDVNASATDPIPRFADTSVAANAWSIGKCATHLLFPFVTNQAGFETGFAISNTSMDQYGTSTQTGICTFNFFGDKAPAAFPTPAAIAAGTTYTNLASAISPGFQGYVIVDCQFQYAHGFAFITQASTFLGTEGYLALIIPDPPRSAGAFPNIGGNNPGEQLGF